MVRTVWFLGAVFFSTLFFSVAGVLGGWLRAGKAWYDWIHRNWARVLLRAAGVELLVRGRERLPVEEPLILISNHQSILDIWALMVAAPGSVRFVAKRELSRIPIFSAACRAAGHVFIDRSARVESVEAIRAAGDRMRREGLSLVLFPEGTRSTDGRLQPFKRGAFALAIETQATLVPVAVDGGREILPPGARRVRSGRMTVRFGEPISLRGLGADDRDDLLRRTRSAIEGLREEEGGSGGVPLSGARAVTTLPGDAGGEQRGG